MVIVKLLPTGICCDTGKTRLTTCRASTSRRRWSRRAIKSTGVGGLRQDKTGGLLHPAYQLMQRKPVKGDETGNFPATYQTSSWYKGRCCNRYNVAEALLIDGS